MNIEFQLKLQAYLDGELSAQETGEVEALLAKDGEGRALLTELRQTSGALAGFEKEIKLPESRDFYWSKIRREIERTETQNAPRPSAVPLWRRILIPAGTFAALVIAGWITMQQLPGDNGAPQVETFLADSGAMTYRDQVERTTVVWLSYPAENDFADTDSGDTLD